MEACKHAGFLKRAALRTSKEEGEERSGLPVPNKMSGQKPTWAKPLRQVRSRLESNQGLSPAMCMVDIVRRNLHFWRFRCCVNSPWLEEGVVGDQHEENRAYTRTFESGQGNPLLDDVAP